MNIVYSFIGSSQDQKFRNGELNTSRPTIKLAAARDIKFDELHILWQSNFRELTDDLVAELAVQAPEVKVNKHLIDFDDPWNIEEVYSKLYDFIAKQNIDPEKNDYYCHISTGTHIMQICWFLLTESRHLPGKLIQTRRDDTLTVIDLNLACYDQISRRFADKQRTDLDFLKSGIATKNKKFNELIETIEKVAIRSSEPILLMGPTGAGKSQLAKRIYELKKLNKQISGSFVDVNCATLRGDQAMSALFGHKKGAFTGAAADRPGLLKTADGGIIFLDEIGELGLDEQAMLLRAIEEKVFLPLGADKKVYSDFQLICGTNRDLRQEVQAGKFREDLLARIDLWSFRLPGLAERREDIKPNLEYELEKISSKSGLHISFNKEGYKLFMKYALSSQTEWRGNFRELNAIVIRLATLAPGGRIDADTVKAELERLQNNERSDADGVLTALLPPGYQKLYDPFDLAQLEYTVKVCREAKNISEAGRKLFAVSRDLRKTKNDTDRLTKYLAKFGLSFDKIISSL